MSGYPFPDEDPTPLDFDDKDEEPEMYQCDVCGKMVRVDDLVHVPLPNNAGIETFACEDCTRMK